MSQLDKDFEKTAAKINAKIKEAAKALKEANKLATKAGYKGLILTQWSTDQEDIDASEDFDTAYAELEEKYGRINVGPLEPAMSEAGWSPSSSYC